MSDNSAASAQGKQAWVIHNGQDAFFTSTLCKALEGYGFSVQRIESNRETQRLIEKARGIDLIVTDEELLPVSGTSLVQRMPRLGVFALTAVVSHKIIPPFRVPLSFKRPVDAKELARNLSENFVELAVTQGLLRVAEFFKLPVAELAWVLGPDAVSGKSSVRKVANTGQAMVVDGVYTKGQVVQLDEKGKVVKIVHDPLSATAASKSAA